MIAVTIESETLISIISPDVGLMERSIVMISIRNV